MHDFEKKSRVSGNFDEWFSNLGGGEPYQGRFNAEGRSQKVSEHSSPYNEIMLLACLLKAVDSCFVFV